MVKKKIMEASTNTQFVVVRLATAEVGEVIPYEELTRLIGRSITSNRYILSSAQRIVERDHE